MSTRGQGRLEPMPDKPFDSNSERFLHSIAVSLKRIADRFETMQPTEVEHRDALERLRQLAETV